MIKGILLPPRRFRSKPRVSDSFRMRPIIPEEWTTAVSTVMSMNRAAGPLSESYPRSLLGFGVPFMGGAVAGWFVTPLLCGTTDGATSTAMSIMSAILAFGGLVVGFVVTLMLFTGRFEVRASFSYELVKAYAGRTRYLLSSQAMTLFSGLIMSLLTVAWMIFRAANIDALGLRSIGIALGGFLFVTLLRVLLLPIQIYELHDAWLADIVNEKGRENDRIYSTKD